MERARAVIGSSSRTELGAARSRLISSGVEKRVHDQMGGLVEHSFLSAAAAIVPGGSTALAPHDLHKILKDAKHYIYERVMACLRQLFGAGGVFWVELLDQAFPGMDQRGG